MNPRAFTLIELLVCVAVAAVLIALTAACLSSARAAAREAVCLSNLRQVGVEWVAGVEANRERRTNLPGEYDAAAKLRCPVHTRWYAILVEQTPMGVRRLLDRPRHPVGWDQFPDHGGRLGMVAVDGAAEMTDGAGMVAAAAGR